jgi:AcrR family transcriptional regulator
VLLDAAISVVRTKGPKITMDDVAEGCGISKPIVYRHFGDRDGLVEAMVERFGGELTAAISEERSRHAGRREVVGATIDSYLAFIESETSLYRFLTAQVAGARRLTLAGVIAESIAQDLETILTRQGDNPAAARPWAFGIVGMVELAGDWWLDSAVDGSPAMDRAELVDHLLGLIRPERLIA